MKGLYIALAIVIVLILIVIAAKLFFPQKFDGAIGWLSGLVDSEKTTEPATGQWVTYNDTHLFMGTAKPNADVAADNGTILSFGGQPDAVTCQMACANHGGCVAYTWHDDRFGNSFNNQCHGATTKDVVKIHSASPGRFSGIFSV